MGKIMACFEKIAKHMEESRQQIKLTVLTDEFKVPIE